MYQPGAFCLISLMELRKRIPFINYVLNYPRTSVSLYGLNLIPPREEGQPLGSFLSTSFCHQYM